MSRKDIKESLIDQLELKGATADFCLDLVNDYMALWDMKEALRKDVKKRGVTFRDYSSVGVEVSKNNPSTKEFVMVNKQMLSLLKDLGLEEPESAKLATPTDGSDLL